ncbi:acyl-CoA dehydrogenase family protein [Desertibaculum subflavum]|uniref:acyl-CoA dehydrogenase family protein n=1 Tax=Desertibaculum subflavum TaxID=2268458 RepID=UPI000E66AF29
MSMEAPAEHRQLQDLVARFVARELMPLESALLAREVRGEELCLTEAELGPLHAKCRELGLFALDAPAELGGADLPTTALMAVQEALSRSIVPFAFPPESPVLRLLLAAANEDQKHRYLVPYARGEIRSATAISEPGAGADPSAMTTRAVRCGGDWVINGRKIWVSYVPAADFTVLLARTGDARDHRGISAFLIDKGTKGFRIEREIPMLGGHRTYELVLEDCRVPASQLLGEPGQGFAHMQLRLTRRRLLMGPMCLGMAGRALDMMCDHVKARSTFGAKLADRQAVQWWIADAATRIHACRLMVMDAAAKQDAGQDVRTEASMIKVFATEMATEVIDHAMQAFGAMGMTKEMPLQLMAQKVRTMRIYEGPSEVHRMVIAKRTLQSRR